VRVVRVLAIAIALLSFVAAPALAATVHDVPLPRGSRSIGDNHFASSRGFRKTVEFYQRFLKRGAKDHRAVPVYRIRGVTVARCISKMKGSKWLAIHVFLIRGKTQIYVVPAAKAP
jgi:hypothetical protein